jgi:CRP/FNR family cyclic AMP-dependent transcriptional regulator
MLHRGGGIRCLRVGIQEEAHVTSPLTRVHLFQTLPETALLRLEQGATLLEPHSGTELFDQGDAADAVYAIVGGEGRVQAGSIDRRTKRLMVEVFVAGDIFGEIGVIDPGPRTAAVKVEGRVRLMRISATTFLAVLDETPELGAALARLLAHRLRRTYELFQDAAFEQLDVRLARQVLYLAKQQGRRTEEGVILSGRLKQPDLADLLGATTRSIITILNQWRKLGVVRYDAAQARLTIRDEAHLQSLIETSE